MAACWAQERSVTSSFVFCFAMIFLPMTYQTQKCWANAVYRSPCLQASEEPQVFDLSSDAEGGDARDMRDDDGYSAGRVLDQRDDSSLTMLMVKPRSCFALHHPHNVQLCSADSFQPTCFFSSNLAFCTSFCMISSPQTVSCMAWGRC